MDTSKLAEKLKLNIPKKIDTNQPLLIVENQQDMRMICVHHLQQRQFKDIIQASTGMEAMEKLFELRDKNKTVSAIICSNELENLTGIDFLDELQACIDLKRPPFMMSVANITKEKLLRCVESGVDEIVGKPFTLADLIPKLQSSFSKFNNPKNPELIYEYGKDLINEKNFDRATAIFQFLSKNSPDSARPLVALANIERAKGNLGQSLQYLEEAESKNPHFVHTFTLRGKIESEQKENEKALISFKKAIELSPLNPIRYIETAKILMDLGKYEEVVAILKEARKHELEFPQLHHFMSQAYIQLKDYPKALKFVMTALKYEPENLDYLNQLAVCHKSQGSMEEALKSYNAIIKLDPSNERALFNKSILLQDTKRVPEAIKVLERLLNKNPEFEKAKKKLAELKKGDAA